jgi:hypothetical protein
MLDRHLRGRRCRTVRPITHPGGYMPSRLSGTVRYTTENLGRTLVRVDLDAGPSLMLLRDDIALDGSEHAD